MADGLNVSSGIGQGAAQVYNTSGSTNYFLRNIQQQQAKRAQEQQLLQSELSKPKMDGIRDGDRPEYIQKYNDWKNTYRQIVGERDLEKKSQLKSDFDKKEMELYAMIDDSKNLQKERTGIRALMLDPTKRSSFADDAVTTVQSNEKLSRNDPNFVRDLTTLGRKLDTRKVEDGLTNDENRLAENSVYDYVETKGKQGNRSGVFINRKRIIDPKKQADLYLAKSKAYPNFDAYLNVQYPNMPKEQQVVELAKARQINRAQPQEFKANDDSFEKHVRQRQYDIANPTHDTFGYPINVAPTNTPFYPKKTETTQANPSLYSSKTVALSTPLNILVSGGESWGADGKPSNDKDPSTQYGLVGFKEMYKLKTDIGRFKKGTIVQQGFAERRPNDVEKTEVAHVKDKSDDDKYIKIGRIPPKIFNTKGVKDEWKAFKAGKSAQPTKAPNNKAPKLMGGIDLNN